MGVVWNAPDEKPVGMIADRDLFLDKSGERLAVENSAESASLLVGRGREIDPADIVRLRLVVVDGRVEQAQPQVDGDAGEEVGEPESGPESPESAG